MKIGTRCIFDFKGLPKEYHNQYPFSKYDDFIYLGEISNMKGHCIVKRMGDGEIFRGYHIENFVEIKPLDEHI